MRLVLLLLLLLLCYCLLFNWCPLQIGYEVKSSLARSVSACGRQWFCD
jgi:hypothetical protein